MLESFWGVILVIVLIVWSQNLGKRRKALEKKMESWSIEKLRTYADEDDRKRSQHNREMARNIATRKAFEQSR
jgi:hypothetical protein